MKKIPRKFIFLFIFLGIFILCIPIYYVTMYFNTKVDVKEQFAVTENVRTLSYSSLNDYKINLNCLYFDVTDDYAARYEISINDEKLSGTIVDNKMTVKAALASNWIAKDAFKSSTNYSIDLTSENNKKTLTISDIEIFANHTNILLPFPKPTLYILITYSLKKSGVTTKYNDIISYPYGSYNIATGGYN